MYLPEDCPECYSSHVEVIESRLCVNGTRRRRMACITCSHRWTSWEGERPNLSEINRTIPRRKPRKPKTQLTAEQVKQALLNRDASHAEMGRLLGRSPEAIRQLRHGVTHSKVLPKIPRWGVLQAAATAERSCYACANWSAGQCAFGFPDPHLEGPGFADDCDLYSAQPRSQSSSRSCAACSQ